MVASTADSTCKKTSIKSISGKRGSSPRVIINGLIKLIDGQKRFADEFGLPFNRVFRHSATELRHSETRTIMRAWLQDDDQGPAHLAALLNDIIEHNLALCAALDGVALESLDQLSPTTTRSHSPKLLGVPLFVWRTFRKRVSSFMSNDYLRHQQLVVTGFSKAYDQQRLKHSQG